MNKFKTLFIGAITLFTFQTVTAQKTKVYTSEIKSYNYGLELFDKAKYGAAIRAFETAQSEINDINSEFYVNAAYYKAVCALNLFNRNAEYLLKQFIQNYPESPRVRNVYFQLGRYNYRKKNWKAVIHWLSKSDVFDLKGKELNEYYFRMGYAHFQLEKNDLASQYFAEIKDVENEYYAPANYYYGHIAYMEGKWETALKTFKKLENHPKFAILTPYYITQIYHYQEKYDELIEYALPILENPKTKRKGEISKIVGEAYYNKKQYIDAIPYLEKHIKESRQKKREDKYQLGFAYYNTKDFEKAIKLFKSVSFKDDSLAQIAVYQMADCHMKLVDQRSALTAFEQAYVLDHDKSISEDALFSYAKLAYQMGYDPYSKSIDAFITYLEKYPNAYKKEEAYDYLINIYLNSKNYRSAIASLEMTQKLDPRLKKVYQQLLFNFGVEQFINGEYLESIKVFEQSLKQSENKELSTKAYFWIAEAHYRLKNYPQATEYYSEFLFQPRAILMKEFRQANYGIGYAYFKTKRYEDAAGWFRKFVGFKQNQDSVAVNDAYIRIGDCYFISKKYYLSLEYYQKAIDYGIRDTDYALYQYAMANGVMGKGAKKMELMEQLVQNFGSSKYLAPAKYQLGSSYHNKGQFDKALAYYKDVAENYKTSSFRRKSLENIGVIQFNNGNNQEALTTFKSIVNEYPNYTDSKNAIKQIENIYKELGDIPAYESYLATIDFMDISSEELDTLTYDAAYFQYVEGKVAKSIDSFDEYLKKFDKPLFKVQANFYRAEGLFGQKRYDEAIVNYDVVLNEPLTKFSESSAINASYINYINKDYQKALENYNLLKLITQYPIRIKNATLGQMRCHFYLEQFDSAMLSVNEVLKFEQLEKSEILEAEYIRAKSLLNLGEKEEAFTQFKKVASLTKARKAAEAKYQMAKILFEQTLYDSAEVAAFEAINHEPTSEDWLARSMILLSDIYHAKDDNFQAKATLETIIENYKGDQTIIDKAKEKLQKIIDIENPEQPAEEAEEEIDLNQDGDLNYDILFDEEELEEEEIPGTENQNNQENE